MRHGDYMACQVRKTIVGLQAALNLQPVFLSSKSKGATHWWPGT